MSLKSLLILKDWYSQTFWFVISLCAIVLALEYSTPPDYVFGYLYIGPILLASAYLSRVTALQVTFIACVLTLSNLWLPGIHEAHAPTISSRLIATLALIVTGILSDRSRCYQQALLQQQIKLQAQEKVAHLREDFAATLAHDLKTPLLGAIETLKALHKGSFGSIHASQQQVLATMIRSHQTTLKLVETLLDVYRNDTEGLQLNCVPIDLVEIAEEVALTLTELAASRRVHLSFSYGESDFRRYLWVNGDGFQLRRVFANLLTNAINHSVRGGKIEVLLESAASYQIVKVCDSGAGIPLEAIPYLFERFYQGDSDRQTKGSGLGLYLSRQIVEAHNGKIWAENRHPIGTMCVFRLPALPFQSPLGV